MSDKQTRVLNVEDHAPARFLRTRILEGAGFQVLEADSAASALTAAADASVVLLDLKLPDGDGFAACELIKAKYPSLPVVMVTSVYRTADARRDGFAVGADAFLLDPVEPARLVRTINDVVSNAASPARARSEDAWVITSASGQIEEISASAAKLLNLTARGALGRSLPAFVVENRSKLLQDLERATDGLLIDTMTTLHPRDRRPKKVRLEIAPLTAPGSKVRLRWQLTGDSN